MQERVKPGDTVILEFVVQLKCRSDDNYSLIVFADGIGDIVKDGTKEYLDVDYWDLGVTLRKATVALREKDEHPERPR